MKKILILVLLLVLAGAGTAYYFYNKPHDTVEQHEAVNIDTKALTDAFVADEKAATGQYLGKVILVNGKPSEITKNDEGKTVLFFSEDGMNGVQCTLRDTEAQVVQGQPLKVRGFCNGYTTVVLLSDCVIEK